MTQTIWNLSRPSTSRTHSSPIPSPAAPTAMVWSNHLASAFHDARERLRTSTLMGISSDGKFETFSYCHGRRVFDVQDAPEHVRLRLGRSVNEKRSHR